MPIMMVLLYCTIPNQYKKSRKAMALFYTYAVCAVACSYIMISISLFTENILIRSVFSKVTLVFSVLSLAALVVFCVRYLLIFIAIRTRKYNIAKALLRDVAAIIASVVIAALLLTLGTIHFNNIMQVEYDVSLAKTNAAETSVCRIGLISDVHLGCGASRSDVDRLCKILKEQNYDCICIAGDVDDMTTYETDLKYFTEEIAKVRTRYGIYYAEGNHEKDSKVHTEEILAEKGIVCLFDEAAILENGVTIVGRRYESDVSVGDVLDKAGIDKEDPVVVLQHRPNNFDEMYDKDWLVLCGHTHGYQIPVYGLINPIVEEVPYGYLQKDNLQIITTSGVSAWGFRIKWPSYNEVVSVKLSY